MMRTMLGAVAVALATACAAGSASAYTFSPAPSKFTAVGPASATLNGVKIVGTATFKGKVAKSGKAKIDAAKFCGGGGCDIVVASGLPWAMKATGASSATIANVTITSNAGACGPANLHVTVSGGLISYDGPLGQCTQATLSLTTSPTLSIVD